MEREDDEDYDGMDEGEDEEDEDYKPAVSSIRTFTPKTDSLRYILGWRETRMQATVEGNMYIVKSKQSYMSRRLPSEYEVQIRDLTTAS